MWSVVERTALAEAEIEYADYESDTIWVKFPIAAQAAVDDQRSAAAFARPQRLSGHLDDDAVDHPRQPGDQLLVARSPTASTR